MRLYTPQEQAGRKEQLKGAAIIAVLYGFLMLAALLAGGCTQAILTKPDGTSVRYMTLLKDIESDELGFEVEGVKMNAKGYNSNQSDGAERLLRAGVEGAVMGAMKGAKQ